MQCRRDCLKMALDGWKVQKGMGQEWRGALESSLFFSFLQLLVDPVTDVSNMEVDVARIEALPETPNYASCMTGVPGRYVDRVENRVSTLPPIDVVRKKVSLFGRVLIERNFTASCSWIKDIA